MVETQISRWGTSVYVIVVFPSQATRIATSSDAYDAPRTEIWSANKIGLTTFV